MKTKAMEKHFLSKKKVKLDQTSAKDANCVRSVKESNTALMCLDNNRLDEKDVSGNGRKRRRLSKMGLKGHVEIDGRRMKVRRSGTVSEKEVPRILKKNRILRGHQL